MGYRPKRKTYALDFEGTDYDGLEVRLRGLTTGELLDAMEKKDAANEDANSGEFRELLELVAEKIVDWNVEDDDGRPVEPTLAALIDQDPDFNLAIINAWTTAISGVPAPLDDASPGGDPSVEASIPMEPLPESLAS